MLGCEDDAINLEAPTVLSEAILSVDKVGLALMENKNLIQLSVKHSNIKMYAYSNVHFLIHSMNCFIKKRLIELHNLYH